MTKDVVINRIWIVVILALCAVILSITMRGARVKVQRIPTNGENHIGELEVEITDGEEVTEEGEGCTGRSGGG